MYPRIVIFEEAAAFIPQNALIDVGSRFFRNVGTGTYKTTRRYTTLQAAILFAPVALSAGSSTTEVRIARPAV